MSHAMSQVHPTGQPADHPGQLSCVAKTVMLDITHKFVYPSFSYLPY